MPSNTKEYLLVYNKLNAERIKAVISIWKEKNIEKIKATKAEWYRKNKKIVYAKKRKWRLNNPGKHRALQAKRRAMKLKATPPWLSKEHLQKIEAFYIESARLTKETGIWYSVDHIWPIQGNGFTGLHVPWNLRVVTFSENSRKHNTPPNKGL